MRRPVLMLLATVVAGTAVTATPDLEQAREAAGEFGRALTRADVVALRPLLPARGKVQLRLDKLGPERGHFSAGQVEALLGNFLSEGSVRDFEVLRVESDRNVALVHGRAVLTDRRGLSSQVRVHLAFQPEDGHWVLREIRELSP